MMTKTDIRAYLNRLGVAEIQPPTLAYLAELHQAHVRTIPWETVDIFAGKPAPIDVEQSVRLMIEGRSGYCFHLNGAFSTLLRALGYKVSWHRGGVQPLGEAPRVNGFHIGVTVELANEAGEAETWIVDAGLGDMPLAPLPLRAGIYEQGPLIYRVAASEVAKGGWRLEHQVPSSYVGVDYAPEVVTGMETFEPQHEQYVRSPSSPWIQLFLVRHRHAEGSNELRGCIWSRRDRDGLTKTELQTRSQWFEVLGDVFHEPLVRYDRQERDEIWRKVSRLHEEWKRAKAATHG
ncbi:arylamine N-acetyltransferase family protein [Cohnella nanjingensis]|uniref:Arylamine N-acetyltransferase n=1 Tax=Cohnella nanjingensis TaxID=1387779 RepID=A0A7X0RV56_9BACL|nr:arylamine N-acetyltransferase [Cohnella nanjingensis]MBB6673081.1 arylamine N-acetyltransferase [Cohnella nanjingensis]